jgi:hypothetical protein
MDSFSPQGLKAQCLWDPGNTTEVMSCHKMSSHKTIYETTWLS